MTSSRILDYSHTKQVVKGFFVNVWTIEGDFEDMGSVSVHVLEGWDQRNAEAL